MSLNRHVNKNLNPKKQVDYRPTPVVIASALNTKAEINSAAQQAGPTGSVVVIEPAVKERSPGLREAILVAPTAESVAELLTLGAAYKDASPKNRRRWDRAAKTRLAFLGAQK